MQHINNVRLNFIFTGMQVDKVLLTEAITSPLL